MPADPLFIDASAGAPSYTAQELRQALATAIMWDGRAVGGRHGVRPGGTQLQVTLAGSVITVAAGCAYVDPAIVSLQGGYWVGLGAAENPLNGPLQAADATNPRKDIVVLRVYDNAIDASGLRTGRTEYIVGTPNPSPAEPATPAGALKLARIDVPQVGGGSAVVTQTATFTVAAGGILPVNNAADISAAVEGRYRDRLDTNVMERDTGAAWETIGDPNVFKAWDTAFVPVWTASGSNPAIGNGTIIGRTKQIGQTMNVWIRITWGTTTTPGTGAWRVTLPTNPTATMIPLGGFAFDFSASATYPITCRLQNANPGIIAIGAHTTAGVVGNIQGTHPFTWGDQDVLSIIGTYPLAP